jgi:L-fuconolactonase
MTTEFDSDAPLKIRQNWLDKVTEDIVDPNRRIVDPHHHFFAESEHFPHYSLDDLWADTGTHKVEQTVYLQCWEGYRKSGPEELQAVGETEWVHSIAAEARKQPDAAQICAMIGTAELRLGAAVRPVLEAHQAASPLFRGIRQPAAWDASEELMSMPDLDNANLYGDSKFREGFALLDDMNLSFDAYHYHHQTPFLTDLARAFPDIDIILNHLGTPPGIGPYAGRRTEIYEQWTAGLKDLATCPNVTVKLGGLAMPWTGFGFEGNPTPPSSDDIVREQARYYHFAIDAFGPSRCMFESNFPVDKLAVSYPILWNAFKKMVADFTEEEKDQMFRGTATRVYGLDA